MNKFRSTGSIFQFENKDTCVNECRPLVDPLPLQKGNLNLEIPRTNSNSSSKSSCNGNWNAETPTESVSKLYAKKALCAPAGSPSFARRHISNGHFQTGDLFRPSIRIHHPPGGVDRVIV